ncbi:MAG: hypothetical protein P1P81_02340 [Desulfobulbales bacterium]|nr:hypothetical protein [Desulfobulbales bacterium]
MDIPHKFQKIGVLITDYGFITILKEMAMAFMANVISDGIAGQQTAHKAGKPECAASKENMGMVGKQSPGINSGVGISGDQAQPIDEISPVLVIIKNPTLFNPSHNNMMQGARCIQPRLTRHDFLLLLDFMEERISGFVNRVNSVPYAYITYSVPRTPMEGRISGFVNLVNSVPYKRL